MATTGPQGSIEVIGCTLSLAAYDMGSYDASNASCVWQMPALQALIVHAVTTVGDGTVSVGFPGLSVRAFDRYIPGDGPMGDGLFDLSDGTEIPNDHPWLRFGSSDGVNEIAASRDGTTWTTYGTSPEASLSQLTASVTCEASQGLSCRRAELQLEGALFACP